jgi:hypothetical protein
MSSNPKILLCFGPQEPIPPTDWRSMKRSVPSFRACGEPFGCLKIHKYHIIRRLSAKPFL